MLGIVQGPVPEGRIPIMPKSLVMGLFGHRGSGKSALMAMFGINEWKLGRSIYYYPETYALKLPFDCESMSPEELVDMPDKLNGATVLLDEMQELMSKYRTNTTSSQLLMAFLRQVRKRGANVFFTSNDPGGINRQVADQTDIHGNCRMVTDGYCELIGYHRRECGDKVSVKFIDTQGKYGRTWMGDRKSIYRDITGIASVYEYYDTTSIADPLDVMMMTKDSIYKRRAVDGLNGMNAAEFEAHLAEKVIPALVEQGITTIAPGNFIRVLKREESITIDAAQLGKHLGGIGLPRHRRKTGNIYKLPSPESLDDYLEGVWEPDDDL